VDLQTIVNLLVGVGVPVLGMLFKRQSDRDKEFTDFRIEVAHEYVRNENLAEIRRDLREILNKLDGKADKA
jgi:uncharacterized protein YydD (DUF2326 family)